MNYDVHRILGCLRLLNDTVSQECAKAEGIEGEPEIPTDITETDIAYLLGYMRGHGIPLKTLITATANSLWFNYLLCQVDEQYRTSLALVAATGDPRDTLLYFRKMYGGGEPVIADDEYDILERLYIEAYPELQSIHETTYDSDDIEGTIVEDVSPEIKAIHLEAPDAVRISLSSEKSTSIRPVLSPEEAFDFWIHAPLVPVHFSAKIDGINTKAVLGDVGVELSLSRARKKNAEPLDYTKGLQMALASKNVDFTSGIRSVVGEASVAPEGIMELNRKYPGRDYKTSKSTAMAMLRATQQFEPADYKWVSFYAFACDDLPVEDAYEKLNAAGFLTPYAFTVPGEEIPRTTVGEFNAWLEEHVFATIWSDSQKRNIQTDGVVMYLTTPQHTERKDVYSDDNVALKFGPWKSADYESRVVNIVLDQCRVEISVVLEIEPVVTRDMNTATRVGGISLAQLVDQQIKIGDMIKFTRKSEAYNVFLCKVEEEEEAQNADT